MLQSFPAKQFSADDRWILPELPGPTKAKLKGAMPSQRSEAGCPRETFAKRVRRHEFPSS